MRAVLDRAARLWRQRIDVTPERIHASVGATSPTGNVDRRASDDQSNQYDNDDVHSAAPNGRRVDDLVAFGSPPMLDACVGVEPRFVLPYRRGNLERVDGVSCRVEGFATVGSTDNCND